MTNCHIPCGSEKCVDLCDNERQARELEAKRGYKKPSADEFNHQLKRKAAVLIGAASIVAIGLMLI